MQNLDNDRRRSLPPSGIPWHGRTRPRTPHATVPWPGRTRRRTPKNGFPVFPWPGRTLLRKTAKSPPRRFHHLGPRHAAPRVGNFQQQFRRIPVPYPIQTIPRPRKKWKKWDARRERRVRCSPPLPCSRARRGVLPAGCRVAPTLLVGTGKRTAYAPTLDPPTGKKSTA